MPDFKQDIDEVAKLMTEFRLSEVRLVTREITISFKRRAKLLQGELADAESQGLATVQHEGTPVAGEGAPDSVQGTPVLSPMNGIYYGSPSPSMPPFVNVGEEIAEGQIVGLIEAMKVFNEIPSPVSGTVLKLALETGAVVQPGDVLLYVSENPAP